MPGELLSRAVEREWWMPWVLTSGEWGVAMVGGKLIRTERIGVEDEVEGEEAKPVEAACVGGDDRRSGSMKVESEENAGVESPKPMPRKTKLARLELEAVKGAVVRIARVQVGAIRSARARSADLEEDAVWQEASYALNELLRRFSQYRLDRVRHYEAISRYALYPRVREDDYQTLTMFVTSPSRNGGASRPPPSQ